MNEIIKLVNFIQDEIKTKLEYLDEFKDMITQIGDDNLIEISQIEIERNYCEVEVLSEALNELNFYKWFYEQANGDYYRNLYNKLKEKEVL